MLCQAGGLVCKQPHKAEQADMESLVRKGASEKEGYQQHAHQERKYLQCAGAEVSPQKNMHHAAGKDGKAAEGSLPCSCIPHGAIAIRDGTAMPF